MADSEKVSFCVICGEPKIKRGGALYCSKACQQKAFRQRRDTKIEKLEAGGFVTEETKAQIIEQATPKIIEQATLSVISRYIERRCHYCGNDFATDYGEIEVTDTIDLNEGIKGVFPKWHKRKVKFHLYVCNKCADGKGR